MVHLRHDLYGHWLRDDRGRDLCGNGQERLACLATLGWLGRHWRGPIVRAGKRHAVFQHGPSGIERPVELLDRIPVVADLVRDLRLLHAAVPPASADRARGGADPGAGRGKSRSWVTDRLT